MPDQTASTSQPALPQDRLRALSKELRQIAREAGILVEKIKAEGFEPEIKSDGSVVTPADRASEKLIRERIDALRPRFADILPPDTAFVGEESLEAGDKPDTRNGNYFITDPVDGTSNFVNGVRGKDLYTVNIGLILNNRPVLGVVHEPVSRDQIATLDQTASVISVGGGPDIPLVPDADKDHRGQPLPLYHRGCMSYADFIRGQRGEHHHKKSYEWDTAAQHAILFTVGGDILRADDRQPLTYNKSNVKFLNPPVISSMNQAALIAANGADKPRQRPHP